MYNFFEQRFGARTPEKESSPEIKLVEESIVKDYPLLLSPKKLKDLGLLKSDDLQRQDKSLMPFDFFKRSEELSGTAFDIKKLLVRRHETDYVKHGDRKNIMWFISGTKINPRDFLSQSQFIKQYPQEFQVLVENLIDEGRCSTIDIVKAYYDCPEHFQPIAEKLFRKRPFEILRDSSFQQKGSVFNLFANCLDKGPADSGYSEFIGKITKYVSKNLKLFSESEINSYMSMSSINPESEKLLWDAFVSKYPERTLFMLKRGHYPTGNYEKGGLNYLESHLKKFSSEELRELAKQYHEVYKIVERKRFKDLLYISAPEAKKTDTLRSMYFSRASGKENVKKQDLKEDLIWHKGSSILKEVIGSYYSKDKQASESDKRNLISILDEFILRYPEQIIKYTAPFADKPEIIPYHQKGVDFYLDKFAKEYKNEKKSSKGKSKPELEYFKYNQALRDCIDSPSPYRLLEIISLAKDDPMTQRSPFNLESDYERYKSRALNKLSGEQLIESASDTSIIREFVSSSLSNYSNRDTFNNCVEYSSINNNIDQVSYIKSLRQYFEFKFPQTKEGVELSPDQYGFIFGDINSDRESKIKKELEETIMNYGKASDAAFFYKAFHGLSLTDALQRERGERFIRKALSDRQTAEYFRHDENLNDNQRARITQQSFNYWRDVTEADSQEFFSNNPGSEAIYLDYLKQERNNGRIGSGDFFAKELMRSTAEISKMKERIQEEPKILNSRIARDYPVDNKIMNQEGGVIENMIYPEFIAGFKEGKVEINKLAIYARFSNDCSGGCSPEKNRYSPERLEPYINSLQDFLDSQSASSIIKLMEQKNDLYGKIILEKFDFSDEIKRGLFKQSPELLDHYLKYCAFSSSDKRLLEDIDFKDSVFQNLISKLGKDEFLTVINKINILGVGEEFREIPEVQEYLTNVLIKDLKYKNGNYNSDLNKLVEAGLAGDIATKPEIVSAAKQGVLDRLEDERLAMSITIIKQYGLSEEFIKSKPVQEATGRLIIKSLEKNRLSVNDLIEANEIFKFSQEFLVTSGMQEAGKNNILERLRDSRGRSINEINDIISILKISADFLDAPQVEEALKQGIVEQVKKLDVSLLRDVADHKAEFPKFQNFAFLQSFAKKTFLESLQGGTIKDSGSVRNTKEVMQRLGINKKDTEGMIDKAVLSKDEKTIRTLGVVISDEERINFSEKYGPDIKRLLYLDFTSSQFFVEQYDSLESAEKKEKIENLSQEFCHELQNIAKKSVPQIKQFKQVNEILKNLTRHQIGDDQAIQRVLSEVASDLPMDAVYLPRLLKTLCDINQEKTNFLALRIAARKEVPDKLFSYIFRKLSKQNYLPKEAVPYLTEQKKIEVDHLVTRTQKLPSEENIKALKDFVNKAPNQFINILKTVSQVPDFNISKNKEDVFLALNDLGSITPQIFKQYYLASPKDRRVLVNKINSLKPNFFKNQPIDSSVENPEDRAILSELTYLAYKPIGMDFSQVDNLIKSLKDQSESLRDYKFPEEGYGFNLKARSYVLKKDEKLDFAKSEEYRKLLETNEENKSADDISKLLNRLAKASTDFNQQELGQLLSLMSPDDRIKQFSDRYQVINEKNGYYYFNDLKEILGIYYKDNYNKKLEEFLLANPDIKSRLNKTLLDKNQERLRTIKRNLGEEFEAKTDLTENDLSEVLSKFLSDKVFRNIKQEINKSLKKFQATSDNAESASDTELKAYISKNIGSFFAKASAGICTAQDITLFNRPDHFHINIVENNERVRGNIQAYIIPDENGSSLVLRGFNPNTDFLERGNVNVKDFCENILEIGRRFIKDNNLNDLYVADQTGWHALSNRASVALYMNKYLKPENLRSHQLEVKTGHFISNIYQV